MVLIFDVTHKGVVCYQKMFGLFKPSCKSAFYGAEDKVKSIRCVTALWVAFLIDPKENFAR